MLARILLFPILAAIGCHGDRGSDLDTGTSGLTDAMVGSSDTSAPVETSASATHAADSTGTAPESSSDGTSTTDGSGSVGTTGADGWVVSGIVTRSAELSARGDGIGNVDIGLFDVPCGPDLSKADEAAVYRMQAVDVTATDVEIPFVLDPAVPNGTYWVGGVFDENANLAETPGHAADSGDLVTTVCPMVVVRDADVSSVALVFDLAIP